MEVKRYKKQQYWEYVKYQSSLCIMNYTWAQIKKIIGHNFINVTYWIANEKKNDYAQHCNLDSVDILKF